MVATLAVTVTRMMTVPAMTTLAITVARLMSVVSMAMTVLTLSVLTIAVALVTIVAMLLIVAMTVVSQGAEREHGDQRHDHAMIVVGACGGTHHRQRQQAGRGHHLQFVYALLNH